MSATTCPSCAASTTSALTWFALTRPLPRTKPFGKRWETERDPLRPPLTDAEREIELRLLQSWGINSQRDAEAAGIVWPETRYRDIWSWEADIHEDWLLELTKSREAIAGIINVAPLHPRRRHRRLPLLYVHPPAGNPPRAQTHRQPVPALRQQRQHLPGRIAHRHIRGNSNFPQRDCLETHQHAKRLAFKNFRNNDWTRSFTTPRAANTSGTHSTFEHDPRIRCDKYYRYTEPEMAEPPLHT